MLVLRIASNKDRDHLRPSAHAACAVWRFFCVPRCAWWPFQAPGFKRRSSRARVHALGQIACWGVSRWGMHVACWGMRESATAPAGRATGLQSQKRGGFLQTFVGEAPGPLATSTIGAISCVSTGTGGKVGQLEHMEPKVHANADATTRTRSRDSIRGLFTCKRSTNTRRNHTHDANDKGHAHGQATHAGGMVSSTSMFDGREGYRPQKG